MSDVAGNDRQAVLQCGGGDEQVCSVVPQGRRQLSPSPCRGGIYVKNAVAVPGQHPIQPKSQFLGERWITLLLLSDTPLNLTRSNNAYVYVGCPLCLHPTNSPGIPLTPPERRQDVGV